MLNDAKMRNNGDGTVTFEFQMDADDVTEIAVLKKMMSSYDEAIGILRRAYCSAMLHQCVMCGKDAQISHTATNSETGEMTGPNYYCKNCFDMLFKVRQ